jgi:hypothetical protein
LRFQGDSHPERSTLHSQPSTIGWATCSLLVENRTRQWPMVLGTALLQSIGLHFVFTSVFVIDLP